MPCIYSVWDHLVQVISIFCDTCEAVARLHHCQTPIIHRDLKVTWYLGKNSWAFTICTIGAIGGELAAVRAGSLCPLWFWICHCKSAQARGISLFLYQIQIMMSQGSGVQAIDEEIKKYTTLSYRFLFFRSTFLSHRRETVFFSDLLKWLISTLVCT